VPCFVQFLTYHRFFWKR